MSTLNVVGENVFPVLYFVKSDSEFWYLLVTYVSKTGVKKFEAPHGYDKQWVLAEHNGEVLYNISFRMLRGEVSEYRLNGVSYFVNVPEKDNKLNLALVACNGHESEDLKSPEPNRNIAWKKLYENHQEKPYHLLLQMGDQLYNDPVWKCDSELKSWKSSFFVVRSLQKFYRHNKTNARNFYWQNYCALRSQEYVCDVQAQVPSIMMWDDHDIFDGYGSYRSYDQNSPVLRGVFKEAETTFKWFQTPHYHWNLHASHKYKIDSTGIIVPDLRSLRTRKQVFGDVGFKWLEKSLEDYKDCKKIILVMTVPFVNASMSTIEKILVMIPGQQLYQDDLRDQWRSFAHKKEWTKVAKLLLDFVKNHKVELILVSGEIHLAANGELHSNDGVFIKQLISSGIAHPPPPVKLVKVWEYFAKKPDTIGKYQVKMIPWEDGSYYKRKMGYLDLTVLESENFTYSYQFVET